LIIYFIETQEEAIVKLATFRSGGREKIGLVHGNDSRLFDLATAAERDGKGSPAFASMLALIDAGPAALDQARAVFDNSGKDETLSVEVAAAEILAPIPEPRQMRDGMSFRCISCRRRAASSSLPHAPGTTWPNWRGSMPSARRTAGSLSQAADLLHHQPLQRARHQHHGKMAALQQGDGLRTWNSGSLPKTRRQHLHREGQRHIFGYTIFNDFSARDAQRIEMEGRLGPAKGKSLMAAMSWVPGSSPRTRSAILTSCTWKCG